MELEDITTVGPMKPGKTHVHVSHIVSVTGASMHISEPPDLEPVRLDPLSEEIEYPEGGVRAYSVLVGSFLGLTATFGTLNSVGAIQTYLATHQLADTSAATISWIFSIYMAIAFGVTIFVGPYFDSNGALKPMIIGNVLGFVGLIACANCSSVYQFILALSLCVGVGSGLCISPLVGVISHWFYRNIGLAIGLSSIGGSVGGLAIPLMLRSLYTKIGFVWAIRVLGFFFFTLNCTATFLIKERFKTPPETVPGFRKTVIARSKKLFNFRAFKDLQFTYLVIAVLLGEVSLLSIVTYYGTYAIAQGLSESDSYFLLTIFNATGIVGRTFPNYLSDKLGYFNIMILMIFCSSLSILLLLLPFGSSPGVLYAFILIYGIFSSAILSLTPACLRQVTPVREFGARYGLMYFFVSCGNLVGIPLASAIIGNSSKHSYDMFAMFCGIISMVGVGFWILSRYMAVGLRLNVKV